MEELLKLPGVGHKTRQPHPQGYFSRPAVVRYALHPLSNRLGFVKNEKDPVKGGTP